MMVRKLFLLMAAVVLNLSASAQWEHVPIGVSNDHVILSLAAGGGTVFAGVSFAGGGNDGLFSSTDNGETWNLVPMDTTGASLEALDLLVNGSNVYAATSYFVWISTDYGATWLWPTDIFMHPTALKLALGNGILYAGTAYLVCYTFNNGLEWYQNPISPEGHTLSAMEFAGNTLYVGTLDPPSEDGQIISTTDNGATWTTLHSFTDNHPYTFLVRNNYIFAGMRHGVYRSPDLGQTWEPCGLENYNVYSLLSDGNTIIAGTINGVFISGDNGTTWVERDEGFTPYPPDARAMTNAGDYLFLGSTFASTWRRLVSDILATGEASQGNDSFTLSPNPAKAGFTLSTGKEPLQNAVLRIFSTEGQIIQEIQVSQSLQYIPVNHLKDGMYIVELETNGRSSRQKLVICQ